MKTKRLTKILKEHLEWLLDHNKGKKANLSEANLSWADLSGANLSEANLRWADLSEANLSGANLRWANLGGANLGGANLSEADLSGANISEANLSEADLSEANLSGANIRWAIGNLKQVRSIHLESHVITYSSTNFFIGCKKGVIGKWKDFESTLSSSALKDWDKHKSFIKSVFKKYPALS
jgi:hypothetical protein